MSVRLVEGRPEERRRVVIAGGGVAGVETLLALAELAHSDVEVEVIAPDPDFTYRPLSVAAPFGLAATKTMPLATIAADHGARHRHGALAAVDGDRRLVVLDGGDRVEYEFLVLAMGARPGVALPGALTFRGPPDIEAFAELVRDLESGSVRRVVFAVPNVVKWPLPIYELALMTAAHLATVGVTHAEIAVVTHEHEPLAVFGPAPSERVRALIEEAGIQLITSSAPSWVEPGQLLLLNGAALPADRVVALPSLDVPPIPGVPQGPKGFIPTDPSFRVVGMEGVFAAGDATWYPIKQGGIAAQQADVVAETIAAAVGAGGRPTVFHPMLRGILIGGDKPLHVRAGEDGDDARVATQPLWWPPGKIAGRYLTPYLAAIGGDVPHLPLADLEANDTTKAEAEHAGVLELTLAAADSSARWEDFEAALRWLSAAERLNVVLPMDYARRRRDWTKALTEQQQRG